MTSPLILLVFGAVISGVLGSLFIIISLAVDSWEEVTFNTDTLSKYQVNNSEYYCVVASSSSNYSILRHNTTEIKNGNLTSSFQYYYLYSTYSGVWRMCDNLSAASRQRLEAAKQMTANRCYTFVTDYDEENDYLPDMMKSIGRMQNSAASCFIVSLIDLAAAAIVGTFAIIQKQVSACMVTGVLYCMAGLFSVFGLTIFHTKMYYEKYQCYSFEENELPPAACEARNVDIGWAMPLAWVGVIVCVFAFGMWIFVTRAFRLIKSKTMI
ncbi:uncharacterized protein LOC123564716 [Mercenaria mercenaria]|uniref:uncharacterized protein LOC123564716 n=1 Tax=Mercenaria mercenaria TaxID=6596 RepID=UPI00234E9D20|nr:uncharacterized protein LOC123564716 [Mercenaria mercenaria]